MQELASTAPLPPKRLVPGLSESNWWLAGAFVGFKCNTVCVCVMPRTCSRPAQTAPNSHPPEGVCTHVRRVCGAGGAVRVCVCVCVCVCAVLLARVDGF